MGIKHFLGKIRKMGITVTVMLPVIALVLQISGIYEIGLAVSANKSFLPLFLHDHDPTIPEIDHPTNWGRWWHIPGHSFSVTYKWDSALPIAIKSECIDAISSWNSSDINGNYSWNSNGNVLITFYNSADGQLGKGSVVDQNYDGYTESGVVSINLYYYNLQNWTPDQTQGICGHELGHGLSIGHIPVEFTDEALMREGVWDVSYFNNIHDPQQLDVLLFHQVYP